jgi:hypothetical protein
VFELVNRQAAATDDERARVAQFASAYQLYLQQRFEAAFVSFTALAAAAPADKAAARHRDACRMYMASPPPRDWDGVMRMTEK